MGTKKSFLHFIYAIKQSLISLTIISFSIIFIVICNNIIVNNNISSFLIGVTASLIATLICQIHDKYKNSCTTCNRLFNESQKVIDYLESTISDNNTFLSKDKILNILWTYYLNLSSLSFQLTYIKDYDNFITTFNEIITNIRNDNEIDKEQIFKDLYEKKNKLMH